MTVRHINWVFAVLASSKMYDKDSLLLFVILHVNLQIHFHKQVSFQHCKIRRVYSAVSVQIGSLFSVSVGKLSMILSKYLLTWKNPLNLLSSRRLHLL